MTAPLRVLFVDDDPDLLDLCAAWCRAQNFEVFTAASAEQARAELKTRAIDIVVSDIQLPDATGLDIVAWIREQHIHTKCMLITAHGTLDLAVSALRLGVDDFVIKPIQRQELSEKLDALREKVIAARNASCRVLAIGAHPDDVEFGCGGVLLRHRDAGHEVHILTLSGGEKGGDSFVRQGESVAAAKALGAQIRFGGLLDTEIEEGSETIRVISRTVKDVNPKIAYIHSANEVHQDHRNAHRAALVALREVPNVLCYQSPSTDIEFRPTTFISIEGRVEQKRALLDHYNSQTRLRPYLSAGLVQATAIYWGRFAGYRPVEPFEVIRLADPSALEKLDLARS